jgi:hypothetical protein
MIGLKHHDRTVPTSQSLPIDIIYSCKEKAGIRMGRPTFLHGISASPSRLTHRTTEANMTFCCVLQFLTNIATGEEDIKLRTAIISLGATGCGVFDSRDTSTARLSSQLSSRRREKGAGTCTYRHASRTRRASPFVPAIRVAARAIASGNKTLWSSVEFG